jgi:AGZA family xanthine/uracil permease-like MFS transporter
LEGVFVENFFKLSENKTTVRTEILAGITTFVTMAYIIFVNPAVLSSTGIDTGAVMVVTCLAAALGTVLIGLLANYPFAQAPGMGLNSFFAVTICGIMGYSWRAGLAAVFISGCIFIIITITGLRTAIINAIPMYMKRAISGGIGLFIAYIGIKNAGWLKFIIDPWNVTLTLPDGTVFANAGAVPTFTFVEPTAILALIGFAITGILLVKKVKGSLLLGIIITSALGCIAQFGLGYPMGITLPTSFGVSSIAPTFGQFIYGFGELFTTNQGVGVAIMSLITVLISLTMVDMFDTIGTLVGTAAKAGFLDKDGNLPRVNKALLADAIATSTGAVLGTSTVTTYVESTAGVSAGGRTGLTSVVTAILFVCAIVLSPILGLIPGAATAPILVLVGVMMLSAVKDIEWDNMEIAIPAFMTISCMAFAYSIADGLAAGFILHCVLKLFTGKAKEVSPILYVIAILFIIRFFLLMS